MIRRLGKTHLFSVPAWMVLCLCIACAPAGPPSPLVTLDTLKSDRTRTFDHSHGKFDLLLKRHVIDGWVDYRGVVGEPGLLYEYLYALGQVEPGIPETWSREQQLAFWVNAYNAFTIQAVVERYPITGRSLIGVFFPQNSILQIPGVWTRLKFRAAGTELTLEEIEHDILRKRFGEPRIHFAIVCASRSCPKLRSEAYRADMLERQLEEQAVGFINDPARGARWDNPEERLYLSKIFKWFKTDFAEAVSPDDTTEQSLISENALVVFIRPYFSDPLFQNALADGRTIRVSNLSYDWRLNDLAEKPLERLTESTRFRILSRIPCHSTWPG